MGMHRVACGVLTAVVATASCSTPTADVSTSSSSAAHDPPPSSSGHPASGTRPLYYFEGNVDVAKKAMSITTRALDGTVKSTESLPYGEGAGDVYFHTCATFWDSTGSGPGGQLSGTVQPINLMGGPILGLTAVITSVSDPISIQYDTPIGVYGEVDPGEIVAPTGYCGSPFVTWTFNDLNGESFSFTGEADGVPPSPTSVIVTSDMLAGGQAGGCGGDYSNTSGSLGGTPVTITWKDTSAQMPSAIALQLYSAWSCGGTSPGRWNVQLNGSTVGSLANDASNGCSCAWAQDDVMSVEFSSVSSFVPNGTNVIALSLDATASSAAFAMYLDETEQSDNFGHIQLTE